MRTLTCVLLLGLFAGTASLDARASDLTSVSIDPNDLQQFEQSYENWVQGLVQNVVPSQKPTVLIEMSYTQSPERLQTYSELRVTSHLPGLPEVMDPHITHPSESPLSALVEARRIKVIFERPLTHAQEKILAEVLNNKLKINANAGDRIVMSTIEAPSAPEQSNRLKDTKLALNIVIGCLVLAALLARSRGNKQAKIENSAPREALPAVEPTGVVAAAPVQRVVTPPPPPVKPFQFNDQDRTVIKRLMSVDSTLVSKTSSIVSPTQIILKSEPKAVIRVLRNEKPEVILRAIHGTSILFQKTILSACTSQQRNRVRELAKTEKIKKGQILFAQNLIAAKIHREMQSVAMQSVDAFVKARESLNQEKQSLGGIRQGLMTPPKPRSKTGSEVQL